MSENEGRVGTDADAAEKPVAEQSVVVEAKVAVVAVEVTATVAATPAAATPAPGAPASGPAPAAEPVEEPAHGDGGHAAAHGRDKNIWTLCLAALGVVYGDIGTSPLYALKECFAGHAHLQPTEANVIGILSLIIWSLIGLISILYLGIVLNADNDGEGGILALLALVMRGRAAKNMKVGGGLVVLGLFGSALLYGDGVITPAISVLSAIEGLEVVTTLFTPWIVPITVVILIGLFAVQYKGTSQIGAVFGPVCIVWFTAIALLGLASMVQNPRVLWAFDPTRAISFMYHNGWHAFVAMGSVFLAVTGGEALYADMGHFGPRPIRICWFAFVLPALLLNYLGQGALLISNPKAASQPFFLLVPSWALIPMVILAGAATVIASQAVISGVFSMTRQAIQLGYLPRLDVRHTSEDEMGQIYLPQINVAMLGMTLLLVVWFRTSSNLAAAYGIAVTLTMVITVLLLYSVMRDLWGWSVPAAGFTCGVFLLVDLAFLGANALKILDGGWFPLLLGVGLYILMITWKKGRELLAERLRERTEPLDALYAELEKQPPVRVPGAAIYLARNASGVPLALRLNLRHNKVLHETVVFVTIETVPRPYVEPREQISVEQLGPGFYRARMKVGFYETPKVPTVVGALRAKGVVIPEHDHVYFVGRESLEATDRPGLPIWQEMVFVVMARNSETAASFFGLPAARVVEIGVQVDL